MNLNNPLKTSFAGLAVVAALLSASTARAYEYKDAIDRVNQARHRQITRLAKGVVAMCTEVRDWKLCVKSKTEKSCAIPDYDGGKIRSQIESIKEDCDAALNGPQSLVPLLEKDAPLYRVSDKPSGSGLWTELTEELEQAVNAYNGSTEGGNNYLDDLKSDPEHAVEHLMNLEWDHFHGVIVDVKILKDKAASPSALHRAVASLTPKKN